MKFGSISILFTLSSLLCAETLPIKRVISDRQGRSIDAVLISKTEEFLTLERDQKQFIIEIADLSAADQQFVRSVENATEPTPEEIVKQIQGEKDISKSIINPGARVMLAMPFEKQAKGGICAAASTLNILKFLDPELQLDQREMFALLNRGRSGASPTQVISGMATLGYTGTLVRLDNVDNRKSLIASIHASLNDGRPLLAATEGHAMTLIGYDPAKKTLIIWDQRMRDRAGKIEGAPPGSYEIGETGFFARIESLIFVEPNPQKTEHAIISRLTKIEEPVEKHQIINGNTKEESIRDFLRHAIEPSIAVSLRKKHRVFFADKNQVVELIGEPRDGTWVGKTYSDTPNDEPIGKISQNTLIRILADSDGVFYSSNQNEK